MPTGRIQFSLWNCPLASPPWSLCSKGISPLCSSIHLLASSYPIIPASRTVQPSCPASGQLKMLNDWSSVAGTHCCLASCVFSNELWEWICPLKSPASPSAMDLDVPLHALADMAFHGAASGSCKAGLSVLGSLASYQEGQLPAAARADVRLHTQHSFQAFLSSSLLPSQIYCRLCTVKERQPPAVQGQHTHLWLYFPTSLFSLRLNEDKAALYLWSMPT